MTAAAWFHLRLGPVMLTIGMALLPSPVQATERALGIYVSGAFAAPGAGIVPPVPGTYLVECTALYDASAGASLQLPMVGQIAAGVDANLLQSNVTVLHVLKSDESDFNLGFGLTVPVARAKVSAQLDSLGLAHGDRDSGIGDVMITPITAGWRRGGKHFTSAGLRVSVPTGPFDRRNFASLSQNAWVFCPNVNYTYLDMKEGWDLSLASGVDVYTRNADTDYRSGTMAHLDLSVLKIFGKGRWGLGVLASTMTQVSDDEGPLAARLNGFRGRASSVGPQVKYTVKSDTRQIDLGLKWAHEFDATNRLEGDAAYFTASLKL